MRGNEEVMEELGLRGANPDWPSGTISHVAGFDSDGMYVVDVWESQEEIAKLPNYLAANPDSTSE